ncbi:MAG: FtsX-like permease family protein [Planctomycetaceae bacterium]|nr:FtsX-like permease family protein [Planctomycetaceae bacterium]
MSVLDRKLRRELLGSVGMILAITSIMAIGIAAYVALNSAYRNLTIAQRHYYNECRMADFTLELKKVPVADLEALKEIPGVVEIRPRISFAATVDIERTVEPLNGLVLSLPNERRHTINDILLKRGGYFSDRRDNEVIVNDAFARRHGLHPGMYIHLLLNNQRQELYIVGTAISSEFCYLLGPGTMVPDPKRFGVFYLKQTFAEEIFDFRGAANQVVGVLSPDVRAKPQEVIRRAETLLDSYGVFNSYPLRDQASHRFIDNEIQGLRAFGVINPTIFLVVASLVLNVLMTRLAEQQRVVVGTLKALGYNNWQIFLHFLKFGLCIGAIGGTIGSGLGYWISTGMTSLYLLFYQFPNLVSGIYPDVIAEAVLISLCCGILGSFNGARVVMRLEPAEAMRAKPPAQGGAIILERLRWFWSRLSFGWRMTLRNIFRNRLRTGAGIFAAAMGACVAVDALMLAEAIVHMVDFQFELVQRSDIDLVLKDDRGFDTLNELRQLPGVDYAEPMFDVACTMVNGPYSRKSGITGLIEHPRLTRPRNKEGEPLRIPASGLMMSSKLAELLHVTAGDTLTIIPTKGLRHPFQVRITSISDSYLGLVAYAEIGYLSGLVGEEFAMNGAQLAVRHEPEVREALYRELKQMPTLQAVTARADTIYNVRETLVKNQRVFIYLLVGFAGVIFFGTVLNSSLISLAERQREVATLRVLGYNEWQIGGLFARESLLTNLVGTLAGLPLGYGLNVAVTAAYDTEMFRIPLVNPTGVCVAVVIVGTLFGVAAHLVVQRSIFTMDWLEALKTKE